MTRSIARPLCDSWASCTALRHTVAVLNSILWRTDRWTDTTRWQRPRLCIASRSKNGCIPMYCGVRAWFNVHGVPSYWTKKWITESWVVRDLNSSRDHTGYWSRGLTTWSTPARSRDTTSYGDVTIFKGSAAVHRGAIKDTVFTKKSKGSGFT